MDSLSLRGKRILIAGASGGIGKQVAINCAEAGASLLLTGRNEIQLKDLLTQLSENEHQIIVADLLNGDDIKTLISSIPKIDGFVYCAGKTSHMPANFIGTDHIESLFKINFEAPVLLTAGLLKSNKINNKSSLVYISSVASRLPYFGGAIYSSSKAALEAYTHTLALELAPKKIRVNCLQPTFVETKMLDEAEKVISSESLQNLKKLHPLGFGSALDVANSAVFLLSGNSSWISSVVLPLGGI